MGKKSNVWIGAYPLNTAPIETLQQELSSVIPSSFKQERTPHITILQCNIPESALDRLRVKTRQLGLIGQTFEVAGLRVHPTPVNPEVIVVDVVYNLSPARTELTDFISRNGGDVFGTPAPAHITLWKAPFNTTLSSQAASQITDSFVSAHQNNQDSWTGTIGAVETATF